MWTCPKCGESIEDELAACWNCGTTTDGTEDPAFCIVDPETAESLRGQPAEDPEPHITPGAGSRGLGESMANIRRALKSLSFACSIGAVVAVVQFALALHTYCTRSEPTGLAGKVHHVSIEGILRLSGGAAFAVAFLSACLLFWRYEKSLRALPEEDHILLTKALVPQEAFWRQMAFATRLSILIGFLMAVYMILFGR